MSLNIKNERVHDLVREAARKTGQSQTSVVETAVLRYLAALDEQESARQRRIDEIVGDLRKRIADAGGLAISPEDLYDPVTGLPA